MLNVKQLKELIKNLPDDTKVITKSSNPELRGNMVDATANIEKYVEDTISCFDMMDGYSFTTTVYNRARSDENKATALDTLIIG